MCVTAVSVSLILYRTAFDQLLKVEVAGASLGGILVSFFCAASIIVCDSIYNKVRSLFLCFEGKQAFILSLSLSLSLPLFASIRLFSALPSLN